MNSFKACLFIFLFSGCICNYAQEDVKGSEDHPFIARFPGSAIIFYEQDNDSSYQLPLGSVVKNPGKGDLYIISEKENIRGKVTRIQYKTNDASASDVLNSYKERLTNSGFEIMISSEGQKPYDIGGRTWSLFVYENLPDEFKNNLSRTDTVNMQRGYLSGKIKNKEGEAFVTLLINQPEDNEVYAQFDIIEIIPLKRILVLSNSEFIKKALIKDGHIALYDIYFDKDEYELKPESEPAIKEIAEFLKQNQDLNIYVVAHTAKSGRLDNSLMISKNRASTIVNALIKRYAISSDRLIPEGVGPLSPVTSNLTQEGREKNNRIELVLR